MADVDPSEAFQSREEDLKESIAKQERILKEEGGLNSERGSKAWKTLQEERELLKQEPNRASAMWSYAPNLPASTLSRSAAIDKCAITIVLNLSG